MNQFFTCTHTSDYATRAGVIRTEHGDIPTPIFMPVGTRGSIKGVTWPFMHEANASIVLANTYHLMLRPGEDRIAALGGLHRFIGWDKPILTDSGGFQVFSLSGLSKIDDNGVMFASHIDGKRYFLGPNESMLIQKKLGSDIVMAFDQCQALPATISEIKTSVERTYRWAKQCRDFSLQSHQRLFGIVQGGDNKQMREYSAKQLIDLDFDGYAIGGLSVGESADVMNDMIDVTAPLLPHNKPRYLMGVGTPRNIVEAVKRGVDMFDCVMPTRNGRNGTAFTWSGKVNIKAARYSDDTSPIDPEINHPISQSSKAYLRHLFNVGELTAQVILSMQNILFYIDMMTKMRQSIIENRFESFYKRICELYPD
ncbi:tRNA guanosine(34) transglycosylase Tgt [Chlamydiia bacterium]|jgi:queuine tRNA-ribosyltransferase|nr:tRNA guanosine(34) transglycosylase Tgt [Chlamydiia bacterium]